MTHLIRHKRSLRPPTRPALAIAAGFLLLAGSVTACGNDIEASNSTTTSKKSTDTTTSEATTTTGAGGLSGANPGLGAKLGDEAVSLPGLDSGSSDGAFGPAVESCLDDEAADLSTADADAILEDNDFASLSPEGTSIITAAMNACIPPDDVAAVFSEEFLSGLGSGPNPEFSACLSTELDGQVGELLVEASTVQSTGSEEIPQPVVDLLDACGDIIIGDLFFEEFKKNGVRDEVAQCIADGLTDKVTMSNLIELGQGGELPASVDAEITALAKECETAG